MAARPVLLLVLACGTGIAGSLVRPADAAAFTCPETVITDALRNAPSLSDLSSGATNLTAGNRIAELIADLAKNGMKPALIVDHLVGAYCPIVANDASLSDAQKADRVRRFARQVTGLAYGQPGQEELEVLVDVPLTPSVLRQVEQLAARTGMSRDAWIERAIKQQLAVP
ncbi:ribbon-helix-helix protein, CopG family [Microvirga calopogonii]|uniref:ribbon-helix-helix protein, CopG family n=1 Tax=Microvirga calopogonii TaxID=2078013 RepID=UPI000E0DD2E7|nr:ribbon-helix-helix protein, CopG family [Microvirga calopogonii]